MTQHSRGRSRPALRCIRSLCALSAVLVLIGGTPEAATTALRVSAPRGRIAFESDRDGRWNVYVANADGSAVHRVTTRGGFYPAWSPDGTQLAFTDGHAIYVADEEGKAVRQLIKGKGSTGAEQPAWSPDGNQLAVDLDGSINVVAVDGSQVRKLTAVDAEHPSWSPDGARIAFETGKGLYVIGADGTGQTQVAATGVDIKEFARPTWSPDGQSIAYVAHFSGDEPPKLSAVRVADGAVRVIAVVGFDDYFAWSPDGSAIAFSRNKGGATEIYTVPATGGTAKRVTKSAVGEDSLAPSWSPDGKWLTYMRWRLPDRILDHLHEGSADIAVIRPDGTGRRQVTDAFPTGGDNADPVWSIGSLQKVHRAGSARLASARAHSLSSGVQLFDELAASGRHAVLLSSIFYAPVFYEPPSARLARAHSVDLGGLYGLVMSDDYAAWFAEDFTNEFIDVTLMVTRRSTRRSFGLATLDASLPDTPHPRLAADGSLIVYNPDDRGSKLYRVDTSASKPKLRLIAKDVAVADVDGNRIVGWRGSGTLVSLSRDGHIIGRAAVSRNATTSVVLDHSSLFTTTGDRLTRRDLNGTHKRKWQLIDEGGREPTLASVEGNLAVYVSGVAVHVLQLSSGHDVRLELPNPGSAIDAELTQAGLFYAYNAAYTPRPGRVGFVALRDLAAIVR